ncbi:MAG TPA: hypothetical protein VEH80_12860 [Candidatus Bathyarchaeia archaeon]|nr:hypothetical protein [Candidatus Bathyarchaeia archaeon]
MKGLVLAGLAFALLVAGSAVALRFYRGNKEFKVFLGSFAAALALYAGAFWLSASNLGFLPASWRETSPAVDFGNGVLILALVFHGYWCFCYFACLSPSMSVLVALRARGTRGMSGAEALAIHGSGQPVNLIFQRRLPKLLRGGYVREESGWYQLLARGGRVAALGSLLKRLINAQVGA